MENFASSIESNATVGIDSPAVDNYMLINEVVPISTAICLQGNHHLRYDQRTQRVSPNGLLGLAAFVFDIVAKHEDSLIYIRPEKPKATSNLYLGLREGPVSEGRESARSIFRDGTIPINLPVNGTLILDRVLGIMYQKIDKGPMVRLETSIEFRDLIKTNDLTLYIGHSGGLHSGLIVTEVTRDGEGIIPIGSTMTTLPSTFIYSDGEIPTISTEVKTRKEKTFVLKMWAKDNTGEDQELALRRGSDVLTSRPYIDTNIPTHAQSEWILDPISQDTTFLLRAVEKT